MGIKYRNKGDRLDSLDIPVDIKSSSHVLYFQVRTNEIQSGLIRDGINAHKQQSVSCCGKSIDFYRLLLANYCKYYSAFCLERGK